ncbi:NADH-quinone oxidoreductase subunit NuoG [Flocculibacter collagenilyticus]|uniref:NADH-quinone oxidoreductase subunit NuoG n=1 Tax=Flocculibacter collagenilyticus TaxID=2744479 RepID=UPI0018F6F7D0|nr:NADH-quinone oxidoreductase subunit NuoG [Flocculibacter collagenilyticus]
MITITIDDKQYNIEEGQNLLQAVLSLKMDLPYFCWHPKLGSVGACRQCAMTQYHDKVNDEGEQVKDTKGRLIVACMTPVENNMRVSLSAKPESEFREQVIASLMTNHPHDCPVCSEGGECHLQDMTVMTGHTQRNYQGFKRTFNNQYLGPLIKHEMNRCITCYRCVRFYQDYAGGSDLAAFGSKNHVYFGRVDTQKVIIDNDGIMANPLQEGALTNIFAGNLAEVCPTGVFTDKPFTEHYSRKWDLQSAPSVCTLCSVGCNTSIAERYGALRRITNRYNPSINHYFICDKGRFGFGFVNHPKRIKQIHVQGQAISINNQPLTWHDHQLQLKVKQAAQYRYTGIGSSRASLESNFALKKLVGSKNFCSGLPQVTHQLLVQHMAICQQYPQASIEEIEQADAVLILSEDILNTAPRIYLAVRQALNTKAEEAAQALNLPTWQDAAVKQIKHYNQTPLFITGSGEQPLVEASTEAAYIVTTTEQSEQIANAIAQRINPEVGEANGDNQPQASSHQSFIKRAINALKEASRPLIITGWSSQSAELLKATSHILEQLGDKALSCIIPEQANSLGVGLLIDEHTLCLEQITNTPISSDNKVEPTGLIVLENDLNELPLASQLLEKSPTTILIDHNNAHLLPHSHLALPATTFAESQGHLVNYQGAVQPFYPVCQPQNQVNESWKWLVNIANSWQTSNLQNVSNVTELQQLIEEEFPRLAGISNASHPHRTARQTARASGRTAMLANTTVQEPKPVQDKTSPFTFSMEGLTPEQLIKLQASDIKMPYTWAAGWNSNQSVHKFVNDIDAEHINIFSPSNNKPWQENSLVKALSSQAERPSVEPSTPTSEQVRLIPTSRAIGSNTLSMYTPELASLALPRTLWLPKAQCEQYISDAAPHYITISQDEVTFTCRLAFCEHIPTHHALLFLPHYLTVYSHLPSNLSRLINWQYPAALTMATSDQVSEFEKELQTINQSIADDKTVMLAQLQQQDEHIPIHFFGEIQPDLRSENAALKAKMLNAVAPHQAGDNKNVGDNQ